MLKKININDIILTLKNNIHCKIEDSHLWKVLEGSDDEHNYYYRDDPKAASNLQEFKDLSIDFEYLSGKFSNSYIVVKKCGNKYYTIDGDHRLTILKFNGIKEVLCLIKMSVNLYIKLHSGICNQIIPLISAIRLSKKLDRKLFINFDPLWSYCGCNNTTKDYIYNFINIDYSYNILDHLNNITNVVRGDSNGNNNKILLSDTNKNVIFTSVCHIIGYIDDNITKYIPYPKQTLYIDSLTLELRHIAKSMLKPIPIINDKINEIVNLFNTNVLGLHVRTCDGGFIKLFNKNNLIIFIENFLNTNTEWKIYLAIDNISLEKEIFNKFKGSIICLNNPFGNKYEDKIAPNNYGIMNAICELYILSKCTKFVGSKGSSFSFYSWLLSDSNKLEFW